MAGGMRVSGGRVRTPVGDAPVIPLALVAIGGYLLWFSSHYWAGTKADGSTLWPSDPVKAVLQGKALPPVVRGPSAGAMLSTETANVNAGEQALTQAQQQAIAGAANLNTSGTSAASAANETTSGSSSSNQQLARMLAMSLGHADWTTGQQWADWVALWNQESGWNADAANPSSGAYGIAQALGHGNGSATAGVSHNEYGAQYGLTDTNAQQANNGDPRWQIVWGIGYIAERYGSPSAAEAHERSAGWY